LVSTWSRRTGSTSTGGSSSGTSTSTRCRDAALAYRIPFISGKDSLFNEYRLADGSSRPIPGTLLISAIGIVPDTPLEEAQDMLARAQAIGGRVRENEQVILDMSTEDLEELIALGWVTCDAYSGRNQPAFVCA
jgi:phosphoribosylformylglycinamidine (FGAM) synthase-like enzyme